MSLRDRRLSQAASASRSNASSTSRCSYPFFPQLVAGPIVRARDLLPQLASRAPSTSRHDARAVPDPARPVQEDRARRRRSRLDRRSACSTRPGGSRGWRCVAGRSTATRFRSISTSPAYSDIAIGSAKCSASICPRTSARPIAARSLPDFWRRWHISLSTWLRDYLYIPLGGNRGTPGAPTSTSC